MKRQFLISLPTLVFGAVIWCILQGNFQMQTVFEALFFSSLAAVIQARIFNVNRGQKEPLALGPIAIIKYFLTVVIEVYKASFKVVLNIIKGREDVKVVRIPTKLTNHWHRVIVATSITLTPGTVSITEQKKTFWVLALDLDGETKEELADEVKGVFENQLLIEEKKRGEKHD